MAILRSILVLCSILVFGLPQLQANQVAKAAKERAAKNCSDTLNKLRKQYGTNRKALKYVNNNETKSACEDAIYVQMGSCTKAFYKAIEGQTKGKKMSKSQLTQVAKPLTDRMKTCMARSILQTTATIEKGAAESAKM